MGEIASLDHARARRTAAARAVMHPALRWRADGSPYAHRRTPAGRTACGLPGPLILASPAGPLCAGCYPVRLGVVR